MRHVVPLLAAALCFSCAVAPTAHRTYEAPPPSSVHASPDALSEPTERELRALQQGQAPAPSTKPANRKPPAPEWRVGQAVLQGFFGVSAFENVEREGGSNPDVDGDDGDLDEMPLLGGGTQYKLGGENLSYGLEGFFSFGGRANAAAFVAGGGGAAVAVDVDMFVFDMYGGPFVSTFLGDSLRLYAGAGPLLEWANYDQDFVGGHDSGSGFGYGTYARVGFEFLLASRTMLGLGARWSDSTVDLSGGLGDLEMDGFQVLLTLSRGF